MIAILWTLFLTIFRWQGSIRGGITSELQPNRSLSKQWNVALPCILVDLQRDGPSNCSSATAQEASLVCQPAIASLLTAWLNVQGRPFYSGSQVCLLEWIIGTFGMEFDSLTSGLELPYSTILTYQKSQQAFVYRNWRIAIKHGPRLLLSETCPLQYTQLSFSTDQITSNGDRNGQMESKTAHSPDVLCRDASRGSIQTKGRRFDWSR